MGLRLALDKVAEAPFQDLGFLLGNLCLLQQCWVTILQACFPLLYPFNPPTMTRPAMTNPFSDVVEDACATIKSHRG
jgi:hypothetical protein